MAAYIPRAVTKWKARPLLIKDKLPNQAVQPIQGEGTPMNAAPRIQPMTGQTQYGKKAPASGFGNTGLTGET
jgi:hypothetical protein